jgi:hypothetical protein
MWQVKLPEQVLWIAANSSTSVPGKSCTSITYVAQLCQRIYRKHQRAMDLIFEHQPDMQAKLRDFLEEMIMTTPGMILDYSTKTWVRCVPEAWETAVLHQAEGWTSSKRMLLLVFGNDSNRLHLKLAIGPGPQSIRERLLDLAMAHQPPFVVAGQSMSARNRHKTIYTQDLLRANDYEDASIDELRGRVQAGWDRFVGERLPEITAVLQSADWLWNEE